MYSTVHMLLHTVGVFHGLREIATRERLPGLYRGIGPTLLAIAPFMAVQQSSYDVLKQQAINHHLEPSASLFFLCGSIAGGIAQTVSTIIMAEQVKLAETHGQLMFTGHSAQLLSPYGPPSLLPSLY